MNNIDRVLVLDIETIPGQAPGLKDRIAAGVRPPKTIKTAAGIAKWEAEDRPAAVETAWRRTALSGLHGQVICIVARDQDGQTATWSCEPTIEGERQMLIDFFTCMSSLVTTIMRPPMLVGHNIIGFDIPFLVHRAIIHRVSLPAWFPTPLTLKPWGTDHVFDTMLAWAGRNGKVKMDALCEAFGIGTKGSEFEDDEDGAEIDGSKVWDFVSAGKIDDVVRYCEGDVQRTEAIWRRITGRELPPSWEAAA